MPEVGSRVGADTVDKVLAEFDRLKENFEDLKRTTKGLIETILQAEGAAFHSVQARVKTKEKLRSKYCKADKDYKCLNDISDVVGLRIITYYSDKLDTIVETIGREFAKCGPLEDKRKGNPESFGYSAIHMDCAYSPGRLDIPEYRRFANRRFEIQIATILGHAWAEMHHPWYDELDSPTEEVRRFHRLAAVLELAEQEFLEIRKKKDERELVASVRVASKAPGTPITTESLFAFIVQDDLVSNLDSRLEHILENKGAEDPDHYFLNVLVRMLNGLGIDTIQRLEDQLNKYRELIIEFVARCKPVWDAVSVSSKGIYFRGLSIFHLATLLASGLGYERFESLTQEADIKFHADLDISQQVAIAKDILGRPSAHS